MPGETSRQNGKKGGRPRGVPNKFTGELKEMILQALEQAGGVDYLAAQAAKSPGPFLALVGKVLPLQVTGKDGKDLIPRPVTVQVLPALPLPDDVDTRR